jgi:hypothetical protein
VKLRLVVRESCDDPSKCGVVASQPGFSGRKGLLVFGEIPRYMDSS